MRFAPRKNPKGYQGTKTTTHPLTRLLPDLVQKIGERAVERPDLILASWERIIGPSLSKMTRAYAFSEGELRVYVNNSTLLSLLNGVEKPKLLRKLQKTFPDAVIKTIVFRMGS